MSEFSQPANQPTSQPANQPVSLSELPRWQGGLPGEHEYSTLEGLDNDGRFDEALLAAESLTQRWNGGKFVGLWLYGTPGTGKTHFAIGLARALHEAGADIAYQSIPILLSHHTPFDDGRKSMVEMAGYPGFYARNPIFTDGRRDVKSIFSTELQRVQKPVLLLDDYKPAARKQVAAAVEAGAEAGGLVVVTSNYPDPFKLFDAKTRVLSEQEILMREMAERADGDALEALDKSREDEEQEFSASLRSRIAAGFKFLEFTGDDQRVARSFWG